MKLIEAQLHMDDSGIADVALAIQTKIALIITDHCQKLFDHPRMTHHQYIVRLRVVWWCLAFRPLFPSAASPTPTRLNLFGPPTRHLVRGRHGASDRGLHAAWSFSLMGSIDLIYVKGRTLPNLVYHFKHFWIFSIKSVLFLLIDGRIPRLFFNQSNTEKIE